MRIVSLSIAIRLLSPSLRSQALSMMTSSAPVSTSGAWLSTPLREFFFGPHVCTVQQAFYETPLSICIVNIKPILPGHVLVIPKRVCARFADMTPEEVSDLWTTVHHVGPILERHFGCEAMNLAIQDGRASGQSVPHVHVHILPRKPGDFRRTDDVYAELAAQRLDKAFPAIEANRPKTPPTAAIDPDETRKPRTLEMMSAEAQKLRLLFPRSSL